MDLELFFSVNKLTEQYESIEQVEALSLTKEEHDFFDQYQGSVFEFALFRILLKEEIPSVTNTICDYFHELDEDCILPFLVDWFGRYFAIGKGEHQGTILMLDPAVGEYYKLSQDLIGFFNEDLVEYRSETLAYDRFLIWRKNESYVLKKNECVGFEKLLFLGGEDDISNFSVYDVEMYWELNRQIKQKIR